MRQKHGILFYFRILFLLWTSPWDDIPNFSGGYKLSALSSWKWKYLWLSTYIKVLVLAMQHFSLTNIRNPSAESKIVPKNANSNKGPRFFLDLLKEWNGNFFPRKGDSFQSFVKKLCNFRWKKIFLLQIRSCICHMLQTARSSTHPFSEVSIWCSTTWVGLLESSKKARKDDGRP